jgi:hypothetical protein
MLKDVCISPFVFENLSNTDYSWMELANALQILAVSNSGYLVAVQNKQWLKQVYNHLNHLEPKIKEIIGQHLELLKNRQLIVGQPILQDVQCNNMEDWSTSIHTLHSIRPFLAVIDPFYSDASNSVVTNIEDINSIQRLSYDGSIAMVKTEENLTSLLTPFLSYARKLTIIDPYFNLTKDRYSKTLGICSKLLRERRNNNDTGQIHIHAKWQDLTNFQIEQLKKSFDALTVKQAHRVTFSLWDDRESSIKMHDRYLLTDQAGLVAAAGVDIDARQQSEWSLKQYNGLNTILMQYDQNSSPFKLKLKISDEGVMGI